MGIFVVVDCEADGPCPGLYSMVSFGAATVENEPRTFYGECAPISDNYIKEALNVSGFTREEHLKFPKSSGEITDFAQWLNELGERPIFISDNLAFDWQWINYYFALHNIKNPFGFSGRRIGDIYSGMVGNLYSANDWKKFRKTKHDHNPVNDALGNVEAFKEIQRLMRNKK